MLLKPLKKLIQGKLGSITPAVWACHLLTLRGRGNPYNNIVNSIPIVITSMLLKDLKKLIQNNNIVKISFIHSSRTAVSYTHLTLPTKRIV